MHYLSINKHQLTNKYRLAKYWQCFADTLSFVADPAQPSNKLMRLKAGTNINGNNINAQNQSTSGWNLN